jgi:hypothetical protein
MPKGGAERTQSSINYGQARGQTLGENLRTGTLEPQLGAFRNYYQNAANQGMTDYNNIMGQYQNFANTGGFSPTDIANIRARATNPTRGIYEQMQQGLSRQRALQGGYSPGYATAASRLARQGSQAISDINQGTEANIAEMRQRGQLAGLGGMASIYGTTPGMANMFGNQVLQATNQLGQATQNEMQLPLQYAQMQAQQGQMPGKWQQGFQNVLQGAGAVANLIYPWMGGGGSSTGWNFPGRSAPL